MELLQLKYFVDSAVTQSFKKTAEKYMVPPTSVSASVKRLENELGYSLFDRSANRITLNSNGKELYKSLEIAFSQVNATLNKLSLINEDKKKINILTQAMVISQMIYDSVIEFRKNNPEVTFKTNYMLPEIDFANYDIIVDTESNMYADYEYFDLSYYRIHLGVAKNSPLCGKKLTMKDLENQPFILYHENGSIYNMINRVCEKAGFKANIALQSNDARIARQCAESGLGILPLRIKHPSAKLDYLDVSDFNETETIRCYFKKEINHGTVADFLELLRSNVNLKQAD